MNIHTLLAYLYCVNRDAENPVVEQMIGELQGMDKQKEISLTDIVLFLMKQRNYADVDMELDIYFEVVILTRNAGWVIRSKGPDEPVMLTDEGRISIMQLIRDVTKEYMETV